VRVCFDIIAPNLSRDTGQRRGTLWDPAKRHSCWSHCSSDSGNQLTDEKGQTYSCRLHPFGDYGHTYRIPRMPGRTKQCLFREQSAIRSRQLVERLHVIVRCLRNHSSGLVVSL
jgi:hypothetical protein